MALYQAGFGNLYEFSFERQEDGTYRAYIVDQPSYGNRDAKSTTTHRLIDGNRHYVCWDTPLKSLEEAKKVAAAWADRTDRYILTGKRFDNTRSE